MAKKTKAEVEFNTNTAEFDKSIKKMNQEIKSLTNELKLNATQLKGDSQNVDLLKQRQTLLTTELQKSQQKVSDTNRMLEEAKRIYGEDSKKVNDLSNALIRAKTQEQAIKNELSSVNTQIETVTNSIEENSKEVKNSTSAYDKLKNNISNQKEELEQLKNKYASVIIEEGKNSTEAKKLQSQINSLNKELDNSEKQLNDVERELGDVNESSKKASNDGFTVMKGTLSDLASSGIKSAVNGMKDLSKSAVDAYKQYDAGADNVIKATGATGKSAQQLKESYKNVASAVVGDFGSIGSALGEVNTRFGFTGSELEKASTLFMKFADITGTDATTAVQLVSRAMGDAGIDSKDYAQVLDSLAISAQASGISVEKLTENITKYGAPMRALGFDTKSSIAIFSQWEKAGVNTEIAFSGMKKAISNWSAEGKNAKVEFSKTLEEIAKCPDIASATTKSIEIFGAKAGPDLADAIQGGRFEYSEFLKILESSNGTVEETYENTKDGMDKIDLAVQEMKINVGEYVGELLSENEPQITNTIKEITKGIKDIVKFVSDNGDTIMAIITGVGTAFVTYKFVTTITSIISVVTTLFTALKSGQGILQALNITLSLNPIGLVIAAIVVAIAIFTYLWNHCEGFRNFWIGLWDGITNAAGIGKDMIVGFFTGIGDKITSFKDGAVEKFNSIVGFIKNNWQGLLLLIVNPFAGAFKLLYNNCDGFRKKVDDLRNKVLSIFNGLVSKLKNIFRFSFSLPHIKLPHFSIRPAGWKIGDLMKGKIPSLGISWYAKGGVFTQPTIFNTNNGLKGVGEAGPETVLPLDVLDNKIQNSMLNIIESSNTNNITSSQLEKIVNKLDKIAEKKLSFYIDSQELSNATATTDDDVAGELIELRERGLEI